MEEGTRKRLPRIGVPKSGLEARGCLSDSRKPKEGGGLRSGPQAHLGRSWCYTSSGLGVAVPGVNGPQPVRWVGLAPR